MKQNPAQNQTIKDEGHTEETKNIDSFPASVDVLETDGTDTDGSVNAENQVAKGIQPPETKKVDPLLALAGTLKSDNISESDFTSPPEIRVVKGAYADHPDPLIALLGTLESDVTDIGERHDDYIAAALLAELRGDEDE